MGYTIVITCDRTMASTYHGLLFMGFSACFPQGTLPDWLYYPMFCPPVKAGSDGSLIFANLGMRKIEASLLANGFRRDEVIVAHPDHLGKVIDGDTKIVAITSNDPLGIGPALSDESCLVKYIRSIFITSGVFIKRLFGKINKILQKYLLVSAL